MLDERKGRAKKQHLSPAPHTVALGRSQRDRNFEEQATFSAQWPNLTAASRLIRIQFNGDSLRLEVPAMNGVFQGSLSPERTRIHATLSQGRARPPVDLTRLDPTRPQEPANIQGCPPGPQRSLDIPKRPESSLDLQTAPRPDAMHRA